MSMKSSPKPLRPSLRLERTYEGPVCGLDEAGRGPLAGPVVAACVYIPEETRKEKFWSDVTDSKQLSPLKRYALYDLIISHSHYGISQSTVDEIDQINILQASLQAMTRSFKNMYHIGESPNLVANGNLIPAFAGMMEEKWVALVDGNQKPKNLKCQIQTVVSGDSISLSIAAASILAKVTRDRIMQELCAQFPVYGWSRNAGYGTREHMDALFTHGITQHHRKSFAPVKSLSKDVA